MELRDESEVDTWRGVVEEVRFCYGERLLQVVVAFREGCRDLLVRGGFAFSRPLERELWGFFGFFLWGGFLELRLLRREGLEEFS